MLLTLCVTHTHAHVAAFLRANQSGFEERKIGNTIYRECIEYHVEQNNRLTQPNMCMASGHTMSDIATSIYEKQQHTKSTHRICVLPTTPNRNVFASH